jgi:hypothetical protein
MVKDGRLLTDGTGQARQIIRESAKALLRTRESFRDKTGDNRLPVSPVLRYQRIVAQKLKSLPALSSPAATAEQLGLSLPEVQGLIKSGAIPTVKIGPREYVGAFWLASRLSEAYGLVLSQ